MKNATTPIWNSALEQQLEQLQNQRDVFMNKHHRPLVEFVRANFFRDIGSAAEIAEMLISNRDKLVELLAPFASDYGMPKAAPPEPFRVDVQNLRGTLATFQQLEGLIGDAISGESDPGEMRRLCHLVALGLIKAGEEAEKQS